REFLENALVKYGYNVVTAKDGKQGFDMYSEHNPGLVLLDRSMPKMTGEMLLEKVLKTNPNTNTKFIISSGHTKDTFNGESSLVKAYLKKPYNLDNLMQTIRGALDSE
ncbi:unnamed protein product, partial [marine sediment metagenome]